MDWQTKMNRVIDYIEETLDGEIRIETAAGFVGCSCWELQRLFSFVTHTTLGEYIRGRKLSGALFDLQSSDMKIIDIAAKYGYDSHAAFSRAFNRQFGISPSQARDTGLNISPYPRITFQNFNQEREILMDAKNNMQIYSERGYYVKENAPVYYTEDMEKTCKLFSEVLGWFGDVCGRSEDGTPLYGCVFDYPGELIVSGLTPFRGIHLFKGAPSYGVVGFIYIQGIDKFRQYVLGNGWDKITEIEKQDWGANECQVTTIDGSIIRFFEVVE